MNEYDELLTGASKPKNEYDAIVSDQAATAQTGLRGSMRAASTLAPDQAAKVIKLSERLKLPTSIVARNFDDLSKKYDLSDDEYGALIRENPKLSNWLTETGNAAIARDDLPILKRIENTFSSFGRGWEKASTQSELADLLFKEVESNLGPVERARRDKLKGDIKYLTERDAGNGVPEYIAGVTGYSARQMGSSLMVAGQGAGLGGAAGAAAGAPILGVGAGPGFVAGATAGALTASANYSYRMETAFAFDQFRDMRDVNDNPIPLDAAKNVARAVGVVNAVIESGSDVLLASLVPGFSKLTAGLGGEAAKRAITQRAIDALKVPTRRSALMSAIGKMGAAGSIEGLEEFVQNLVTAGGRETAQAASGQTFKPDDFTDDLRQGAREALDAAVGTFFTFSPVGGARYYQMQRQAAKAQQQAEFFTALGQGVTESKTFERLPEKMQDFIEKATKDGPIENVYVPVEQWVTYWQNEGVDPAAAAAEVLGSTTMYESALATGEDIMIPMGRFATKLAASEHGKFFANEARLAPDEMNAREAVEFEKKLEAEQKAAEAIEKAKQQPTGDEVFAKIRKDIEIKLIAAGVEIGTAQTYAQAQEAAFRQFADRAGISAEALFDKYVKGNRLTIGEGGAQQGEGATMVSQSGDEFDSLISKLKEMQPDVERADAALMAMIERQRELEGLEAAVRDPQTGEVFKGWSHKQAIMSAPRGEGKWSRMSDELDAGTDNVGFVTKDGKFITRSEANSKWNVATKEDIVEAKRKLYQAAGVEQPAEIGGTINVDGQDRPTTNSKGQPIAATEEFIANFWRWFGNSAIVDDQGRPIVTYHGAQRLDRMGPRIIASRASSGPMPFFTDDPEIATGYATGKADVSIGEEELNYNAWFRVKLPASRTPLFIDRAWYWLSQEERDKIAALAPRVTRSDDGEQIILAPEGETRGLGNYDQAIKEARGNALAALVDGWLNSASLYDDEQEFMTVLKLAGMDVSKVEMHDPHEKRSGILPVYLSMQNPLDTSKIEARVVEALQKRANRQRQSARSTWGSDPWAKERQNAQEWMERLREDVANNTTYSWTSIPDWVTDVLTDLGYDGIVDQGGKYSPKASGIFIPFKPGQIKSSIGNRGTFNAASPNVLYQGDTIDGKTGEIVPGPIFYSELENQIERAKMNVAPADQWKAFIKSLSNKGVKKEEIEMSGVMDWLTLQDEARSTAQYALEDKSGTKYKVSDDKVALENLLAMKNEKLPQLAGGRVVEVDRRITKQQVLDHLAERGVKVFDVVRGGPPKSKALTVLQETELPDGYEVVRTDTLPANQRQESIYSVINEDGDVFGLGGNTREAAAANAIEEIDEAEWTEISEEDIQERAQKLWEDQLPDEAESYARESDYLRYDIKFIVPNVRVEELPPDAFRDEVRYGVKVLTWSDDLDDMTDVKELAEMFPNGPRTKWIANQPTEGFATPDEALSFADGHDDLGGEDVHDGKAGFAYEFYEDERSGLYKTKYSAEEKAERVKDQKFRYEVESYIANASMDDHGDHYYNQAREELEEERDGGTRRSRGSGQKDDGRIAVRHKNSWQSSGGRDYVEIPIGVQGIESWEGGDATHFGPDTGGKTVAWIRAKVHNDEKMVPTLWIEEFQSNRAQRGREQGFKGELKPRLSGPLEQHFDYVTESLPRGVDTPVWVLRDDRTVWFNTEEEARAHMNEMQGGAVPPAPFVKNTKSWVALAMKRAIRYAVDNGLKQIAWTTGQQQVDRYGNWLREQVDSIEWTKSQGEIEIKAKQRGNTKVDQKFSPDALKNALGVEMSQRIINDSNQVGKIEGEDITITDLGMVGFYGDEDGLNQNGEPAIVPIVANDIATKILKGPGVKKIAIEIGEKGESYTHAQGIELNDDMFRRAKGPFPLFQREQDTKRGSITFTGEGSPGGRRFRIDFLEGADLTTFIHEGGHFWLEVMGDIVQQLRVGDQAKLNDKQRQMIADYEALLAWLKVKDRGEIGVEQHEQFARGIEAYFMEGKAPNAELRNLFARVRSWMMAIYRSISKLNVTLSPEVRDVFDRMLASDEQIEAAQNEAKIEALFADDKTLLDAGFAPEFVKAYRDKVQRASDAAREELQSKLMRTITREREAWWKAERAKVRATVEDEVNARPEQIALSVLTRDVMPDGEPLPYDMQRLKISRKDIDALYGEGSWKTMPRGSTAIDGLPLQTVAETLGFGSGDALVKAVRQARPASQVIEQETDARMRAEHGDAMIDGTIVEAARAAVQNEERSEVIRAELRALAKLAATAKPAVDLAQQQAAQKRREGVRGLSTLIPNLSVIRGMAGRAIASKTVRDLNPVSYLTAARRASQGAVEAAGAGDFTTAISMKRRELLNVELYRAATKAREEVDQAVDYMQSFGDGKKRGRIAKAGQDYLDQIDGFLDRYDFARVPLKALDRRKALATWVAEKEKAGEPVNLPDDVIVERRVNYKDMTVDELRGVRDSVKHIEHLAKLKNRLLTAKRKATLEQVVEEIETSIRDNATSYKGVKIESRLPTDEALRAVDAFFGMHRKLASWLRQLDGLKDGGVLWEYIMRPVNEAADREATMNAKAIKKLADLFAVYKDKDQRDLYVKQAIPEIGGSLTKMARIMAALNWGNDDNRQKLMDGYGWTATQVEAVLAGLDERDWKFVQGVWDFIDSYWPAIEAKEKRINGIAPEKVERSPYVTRFGEVAGGYFPLKYDDRQSAQAHGNRVKDIAEQQMKGGFTKATTRRGHTKERVSNVKLPIRLDFGVIDEHISQVIHDVTHHEMLIDVNRLLGNKTVSSAVIEVYGDIVYKQIQNAVTDIAAGNIPAIGAFEKSINYVRTGTTIVGLGWSVMTSLLQPLGLAQSIVRIGPKWVGKGIAKWIGDAAQFENTANWIRAKSDFMANRGRTQQREINEIRNEIGINTGKLSGWVDQILRATTLDTVNRQAVADSYFWLIQKAQQVADIPTWLGAYEKAMADPTNDEGRAIALADQAVLDSQGGGQMKDLAAIQRGGPLLKIWTNFYSYFNVTYNLSVESVKRTKFTNPISVGRLAVDFLLLYTLPATIGALMKHALKGGDDDSEKLIEKLLRENLSYMAGMMVGLREIGGAIQGYAGYEGPAGTRFFASIGKLIKQSEQGETDAAFWKALNEVAGILLHYPAGQVSRTADGAAAMIEGDTRNPASLLFGAPKQ